MHPVDALVNWFAAAQSWLFEHLMEPVMFRIGLASVLESGYAGAEWFLLGVLDVTLLLVLIRPLERWRPLEPVTDRAAVRTDVLYTLIHRLALFRVGMFFLVAPFTDALRGWLGLHGFQPLELDNLWPGVTDVPWVTFVIYLVVIDFLEYGLHRAQHQFNWWWALHSLHHSQHQMTMWTDNRNHLIDDMIIDTALVLAAALIGVAPSQFVLLVVASRVLQSLQHANVRLSFGWLGERLLVSPRFHRVHHGIGIGHERDDAPHHAVNGRSMALGGHNFGVLFPWWDMLFRTASFDAALQPTGVRDQLPDEGGRDYGRGFWAQQRMGLRRLLGRG